MKLCSVQDLPEGKAKAFEIRPTQWVGVFHVNADFFAIQDECPHQGWPLSQGTVKEKVVTCIGHGWSFHLDTGKIASPAELIISTFPVKIEAEYIWIEIRDEKAF